jgi:Na+-driven multidrug efflux pump
MKQLLKYDFFYLKRTITVSIITFSAATLNLILNYFLIKENGALGAAQAAVIAFLAQFIIVWIVANRAFPMPWFFFIHSSKLNKK